MCKAAEANQRDQLALVLAYVGGGTGNNLHQRRRDGACPVGCHKRYDYRKDNQSAENSQSLF
jgi:hypothetical protein